MRRGAALDRYITCFYGNRERGDDDVMREKREEIIA